MSASLAIINARIITLNPKQARAQAIAVRNNLITAVGSNRQILKHISKSTKIIDAENKTLIPGLNDCHVHMTEVGLFLDQLDLKTANSVREIQQRLKEYSIRNNGKSWILGGRWDNEKLLEKQYPTRWDLDAAVPDRPVFLVRICGHLAVANSLALKLAGLEGKVTVEGGQVEFDEENKLPNGVLKENAMSLVSNIIPKPDLKTIKKACLSACKKAVESGLTCVHWIITSNNEVQALKSLDAEKKLPIRVYLGILNFSSTDFNNIKASLQHCKMVEIGFVKIIADGSLGSRTAALKKHYSDQHRTSGLLTHEKKELYKLMLEAHKAERQVAVHAIGDRAIETVLENYEQILRKFPRENHRHRIEHCSVLNPVLIHRLQQLGIVASVQPHFIVSDPWLVERLGKKRARWAYPFKSLVEKGVVLASGSDGPIDPIDPLLGMWAAVAGRKSTENLTVEEALRTYTVSAAYSSFDEASRGTIEVGKRADFTLISDDPSRIKRSEPHKVKVEMTVVDGSVVYSREPYRA
jgi:predicted amidohydrolase YtcJ